MDFWFKYDDFFIYNPNDSIINAIKILDPYGGLIHLFHYHHMNGSIKTGFKNEMQEIQYSISC